MSKIAKESSLYIGQALGIQNSLSSTKAHTWPIQKQQQRRNNLGGLKSTQKILTSSPGYCTSAAPFFFSNLKANYLIIKKRVHWDVKYKPHS